VTSFSFAVPGQPLSWNRSYRQRVGHVKDKFGQTILTVSGKPKTRPMQYKTEEALEYQKGVQLACQAAKPSAFRPEQVIIAYDFVLARDIDCDNVIKMTNDAIARALGLDDKHFFPVVRSKVAGSKAPEVMISIYDRSVWRVEIAEG
jgi:hypothetical protein